METITPEGYHVPYAAGFVAVQPGEDIAENLLIETYFSEDYRVVSPEFKGVIECCSTF